LTGEGNLLLLDHPLFAGEPDPDDDSVVKVHYRRGDRNCFENAGEHFLGTKCGLSLEGSHGCLRKTG